MIRNNFSLSDFVVFWLKERRSVEISVHAMELAYLFGKAEDAEKKHVVLFVLAQHNLVILRTVLRHSSLAKYDFLMKELAISGTFNELLATLQCLADTHPRLLVDKISKWLSSSSALN